jgi:DNA transposition AAA+ family ATPase
MATDDILTDLTTRVEALEKKLPEFEAALKVEKTVMQVVVEREGEAIKVRQKVLVTTATEQKEVWEDITNKVEPEIKEVLNGA